jgi:hypothetical protein
MENISIKLKMAISASTTSKIMAALEEIPEILHNKNTNQPAKYSSWPVVCKCSSSTYVGLYRIQ